MADVPRALRRLEFQVLVDNATDSLSSVPSFVTHEWRALMRAGMKELTGSCQCCANHGLSLVLTAHDGERPRRLLFDSGPVGYAVEMNGRALGIPFGAVEEVVLSHGHWDHAGGMLKALELIVSANAGRSVRCHVHPGMFAQRAMTLADGTILPFEPIPDPAALTGAGAQVASSKEEAEPLDGCLYLSGEIARVTDYERGFPGHLRRSDAGGWEPDPLIVDERFVAANLQGHGLVVFTACSHAGVVNVLLHARARFPALPLYAVVGGFHLSAANERIIPQTVRDLAQFGLTYIIPGHCTGWRAVRALVDAFGEQVVVPLAVGRIFSL
jgi:7,8-dihydropterin-6-yl-methyl-4-(beta-D-ribofuranosyl)aminobenzene 5'-phosphate synthase